MSVTVRGRVPNKWDDNTALHLTERLRTLEKALAGGAEAFRSPAAPTTGPTIIVTPGTGGTGTGGGVTDHGDLTGLADDDHVQYVQRLDGTEQHAHGPFDVAGLESRFPNRGEPVQPLPHPHGANDIQGLEERFPNRLESTPPRAHQHRIEEIIGADAIGGRGGSSMRPHQHTMAEVVDLAANDAQFVLAARVFGG